MWHKNKEPLFSLSFIFYKETSSPSQSACNHRSEGLDFVEKRGIVTQLRDAHVGIQAIILTAFLAFLKIQHQPEWQEEFSLVVENSDLKVTSVGTDLGQKLARKFLKQYENDKVCKNENHVWKLIKLYPKTRQSWIYSTPFLKTLSFNDNL